MKRFKFRIKLLALIIIICFLAKGLLSRFDKSLSDFALTQGENAVCEILNLCVLQTTQELSTEYGKICDVRYDKTGKITSITLNPDSINKLKSQTVSNVIKTLKDEREVLSVPLGTLLGSRFFSARGPDINIKLIPLGAVSSELNQKFTSAGINQTLHSIYLDLRVSLRLASPFSSANINVFTNVCIAETVIVGEVPF
jgi:sporulation protein YunB